MEIFWKSLERVMSRSLGWNGIGTRQLIKTTRIIVNNRPFEARNRRRNKVCSSLDYDLTDGRFRRFAHIANFA